MCRLLGAAAAPGPGGSQVPSQRCSNISCPDIAANGQEEQDLIHPEMRVCDIQPGTQLRPAKVASEGEEHLGWVMKGRGNEHQLCYHQTSGNCRGCRPSHQLTSLRFPSARGTQDTCSLHLREMPSVPSGATCSPASESMVSRQHWMFFHFWGLAQLQRAKASQPFPGQTRQGREV